MGYSKIMVGTDGSETASHAVRHAGRLAAALDARLHVVTAFQREEHDEVTSAGPERVPSELRYLLTDRSQAEETARDGRAIAREVGAEHIVLVTDTGDAAEVIISNAEDYNIDLIVIGSVGMTSAKRFVLGSVANTVSHHAPCDVLIVHTAD